MSSKVLTVAAATGFLLAMGLSSAMADTVTTIKTTVMEPGTVLVAPLTLPATEHVMRTFTITPVPVSISSTIELGPRPIFSRRLALMKEQVNFGLRAGWLTALQADAFKQKIDSLTSMAQTLPIDGSNVALSDDIETQTNILNIAITESMKHAPGLGALPQTIPY